VRGLKTRDNTPEVDQSPHTGRPKVAVYVIAKEGHPLMPCSPAKAKHLLKVGNARVVKRCPFTIQLNWTCENQVQEIILGIDTGFGNIGFSAISSTRELASGTLILDGKTKDRLDEKRMYRRGRRNKLWYRQSRFLNRKRKESWLPPSIERRYQTHLALVKQLKALMPISKVVIEVAKFDIQKLEHPEVAGVDYQRGDMYGYQNTRAYLMAREKGLCEHCHKDFKKSPSHVHHRKPRSEQGRDRPCNLMLVHEKCHIYIHKHPALLKKYQPSSVKEYRQSTFMNIIQKRFWKDLPGVEVTYGNITFVNRNLLGLPKSHENDAFVVAGGTTQIRIMPFVIIQKHRNNRVLQLNRKGFKPSIKRQRSVIAPLDLFWVAGKAYVCKGMFNKGKYILYGNAKQKEYFKMDLVDKYFNWGSLAWAIHPSPEGEGLFAQK
jgi:hypothetical protein